MTGEPTAYGEGMSKLFLPEYIYGLSVEKIATYIVVKVKFVVLENKVWLQLVKV